MFFHLYLVLGLDNDPGPRITDHGAWRMELWMKHELQRALTKIRQTHMQPQDLSPHFPCAQLTDGLLPRPTGDPMPEIHSAVCRSPVACPVLSMPFQRYTASALDLDLFMGQL